MEYTRDLFEKLIEKHFGEIITLGGRQKLKDFDNKEIAELLDYDERQFGNCLNPTDNTSYKTVIKRLLTYDKVKGLEIEIKRLKEDNILIKSKQKALKKFSLLASTIALLAIVSTMIIALWLPDKIETDTNKTNHYVVKDALQLRKVMQWHGNVMSSSLVREALILNAKVKEFDSAIPEKEKVKLVNYAEQFLKSQTTNQRIFLQDFHFVTPNGDNIAKFIEYSSPYDSLLTSKSSVFVAPFKDAMQYILDKNISAEELSKKVLQIAEEVQRLQWTKMREDIKLGY